MTEADNFAQQSTPVVWIAFADNGNVRLWTADPNRAKALGFDMRAFTLAELVALVARSPAENSDLVEWCREHPQYAADNIKILQDQLEESRLHRLGLEEQLADTVKLVESARASYQALFEPEESDAYDNLTGALIDIKRLSEQGKPTDAVCINTIERVLDQINVAFSRLGPHFSSNPSTNRPCQKCDGEGYINRHANLPDEPCPACSTPSTNCRETR